MHRIIYISSSSVFFHNHELEEMLNEFRTFNTERGITGMLLYVEGDFIQVMEGEKVVLHELYDKIKSDDRHKHVITLFDGHIKTRQFPDWRMGFSKTTYNQLGNLVKEKELNNEKVSHYDDHMAMILINSFVRNHRANVVIH
jgi:hypothetical protein